MTLEINYCLLEYVLMITGPVLSFIYFISVLFCYVYYREATLDSKVATLSKHVALLVVGVASAIGICEANVTFGVILTVGIVVSVISIYFMYQTRAVDVVGCKPIEKIHPGISMQGKVVLITGANTGIGKETARQLAQLGGTVILACRSEARAQDAIKDIRQSSKKFLQPDQLRFLPIDLSDFSSIRNGVEKFNAMNLTLDVLINNAGVMMGKKTLSKDGLELMMQANHLGHFLLTMLLLPKFTESNPRLICLTSSTYEFAPNGFDFDDMFCDKGQRPYTLFGQYGMTKLANILFVKEVARRHPSILCYAVHPGIVRTEVTRNMPWYLKYPNIALGFYIGSLQKSPAEGAYSSVYCAACPNPPANASFILNCAVYPTLKTTESVEDAKKLWDVSGSLTDIK